MQKTVVNPCALCARLLKHELADRGSEAMAAMVAPLLMRCPMCRLQLPHGAFVFERIKLNLPNDP